MLTDEEFIEAFERAVLPAAQFDHAGHVRAGWWYLGHYPLGEAIDRFCAAMRAFASANGAAGKYHETLSVAWMLLIAERLAGARNADWASFSARYPELFDNPPLVTCYYSNESLGSPRARAGFVMPDLIAARPVVLDGPQKEMSPSKDPNPIEVLDAKSMVSLS